jgi:hypothetical protein
MSGLEYEIPGQLEIADAPVDDGYTLGDEADFAQPLDPAEVAASTDAFLEQVDQVVGEFNQAVGNPPMTRAEWEAVKEQITRLPGYAEIVSEQQGLNRADVEVGHWLGAFPEHMREQVFARANELTTEYTNAFGGGRDVAAAAMDRAAHDVIEQTGQAEAFVQATAAIAQRLSIPLQAIDFRKVSEQALKSLPAVAESLPGSPEDEIVTHAILEALRDASGRNQPRPISEDYSIAATVARDLRPPKVKPPEFDYRSNRTATAANVASGRIPRKA